MIRNCITTIGAALLAGCSMLPGGDTPKQEAAAPIARSPAGAQCLADLQRSEATFTPLPDRYTGQGCSMLNTVQLTRLRSDVGEPVMTNLGPVACPVASAFAGWARFGVDRAAQQILGSPLKAIETYGSYVCRNVAGTSRRSGHATASAIDIAAFVLEDGRRISVLNGWNGGTRAEQEFLRTVHRSACKRFATVLGPDYNAAHENHLHIEGVASRRGFCR
ncbi:extensin family protein [Altericroceibacterium xinjiangense]|uniref:extensin-like domain-containing protein n=1 Tax=Altericroceibacterium xinjiangense TaxID=762261 RepID=UPI000F7F45D4|nr:extensin family protein [Altericroceibacterium xinjiangense]